MIYFRCGIRALGCSWNEQRSRETPSAYILSPSASLEPGLASSPAEEGSPQGKNVHKCDFESPSRRLAVTASLEPGLASSPAEEGSPQGKNVHKCDFESPSRRLAVTASLEPGLASSPAEEGSPQGKNVHKCDFESPSRRLVVTASLERGLALHLYHQASCTVTSPRRIAHRMLFWGQHDKESKMADEWVISYFSGKNYLSPL